MVGAYAWLGDFFKFDGSPELKDAWTSYARINYAF